MVRQWFLSPSRQLLWLRGVGGRVPTPTTFQDTHQGATAFNRGGKCGLRPSLREHDTCMGVCDDTLHMASSLEAASSNDRRARLTLRPMNSWPWLWDGEVGMERSCRAVWSAPPLRWRLGGFPALLARAASILCGAAAVAAKGCAGGSPWQGR
mmetsp:Transcript_53896/g.121018  ORF Transcript_53896/g.121018 Transcript_53896/m.121018 type:complete len:153 (-) Transcript_53896:927-1385(-)